MVSSAFAPPRRLRDTYAPRCKTCDVPFPSGRIDRERMGWCEEHGWSKAYTGPQRENQCASCFNLVGFKGTRPLCAALMSQLSDGRWQDRYGQTQTITYLEGGYRKEAHPIQPVPQSRAQYDCECYEALKEGESRESILAMDPERFYSKKRFW